MPTDCREGLIHDDLTREGSIHEGSIHEAGMHEALVEEMRERLHELCQPLTALQCRLEMGRMQGDTPELLLETIQHGLIETQRMFAAIAAMRERLLSE